MLPEPWVERIFQRMHGLYGNLWLDRYRVGQTNTNGLDVGIENAKTVWGEELAGFAARPGAIAHALDQLRHVRLPPTLPEFLELCRQAPRQEAMMLLEPKCDQETARRHLTAMNAVIGREMADLT